MNNKDITIDNVPAYHAYPADDGKHPGLILIHEIWGLASHIKDVADRFAHEGYSVIAPDLFADSPLESIFNEDLFRESQNPETRDEAQKKMRDASGVREAPEFGNLMTKRLSQCLDFLLQDSHVDGHIGVVGFCFGGTYSFVLAAERSEIKASVPFYGKAPEQETLAKINCPILAFYGEQDERLVEPLPDLKNSMRIEGKDFKAVVYPNCGHAFFNDTNTHMYNKEAAEDSWKKTLAFLKTNLS